MKLIHALTRRWRDRPGGDAWRRYRNALDRNTDAEERLADLLTRGAGPVPLNPGTLVERILSLREERVEILRHLGQHRLADELADDTAMRRGWENDPPIVQPAEGDR